MHGCTACYQCFARKDGKCAVTNDSMNELIETLNTADGLILGSPTYFANVTSEMKAFIDRAGLVALANNSSLKRKAGAAVVAVRRAGALPVFEAINRFFTINQMIIPGSRYWNLGIGRNPGEVMQDEEGIETMKILGQNMAWLLKKIV